MYEFVTNRGDIAGELNEVIRCFVTDCDSPLCINFTYVRSDEISFFVYINGKGYVFSYPVRSFEEKADRVRYDVYVNKHALYKALSGYFGKELPWGSLTGIRPTRLAARLYDSGMSFPQVEEALTQSYSVSKEKAKITCEILQIQSRVIADRLSVASGDMAKKKNNLVNLYVHIPFCPTRCSYCSFISQGIEKKSWLMLPYVDALIREINFTRELIEEQGKKIFSVYIGGGTPTVLSPDLLRKVLESAYVPGVEYTCEAGRPDTIDSEKLRIISDCGVNRISINPQTLHDETLVKIGRRHTSAQFFEAYALAEKFGFAKNVDIIAGLDGESEDDFRYTVDGIIKLNPENITVHTLCVKRGSQNALQTIKQNEDTEAMVDYSISALKRSGYLPYYLYRQKQMSSNLENMGWCREGFMCVNNVTVMEEMLSVYACGAGAIGKQISADGKITRLANPKDVICYLDRFDELLKKKELFE